jgi:dsRNA-specific ribonuclease
MEKPKSPRVYGFEPPPLSPVEICTRSFEREVEALQTRIGYRFKNRNILIQALTSPSFKELAKNKCSDNTELEFDGDRILAHHVTELYNESLRSGQEKFITFINSNVFLSSRALEIALNQCVRFELERSHRQGNEAQIRLTSNALEAVIAAIWHDGGDNACTEFIEQWIFKNDRALDAIKQMGMDDRDSIIAGYHTLVRGKSELKVMNTTAWVSSRGKPISAFYSGQALFASMRTAAIESLKNNSWLLYDYDGRGSMYMPSASAFPYPPFVTEWSLQTNDVTATAIRDQSLAVESENAASELPQLIQERERVVYHAEDSWPEVELPSLLPQSTAERGPYIDKLRISLSDAAITIRSQPSRKSGMRDYALYINSSFSMVVKEQRTLNDAANQMIRSFFFRTSE